MFESIPYLFVISGIVICGWLISLLSQRLRLTPVACGADEKHVQRTIESVRGGLVELRDWLARDDAEMVLEAPVRAALRPLGQGQLRDEASRLRRRGRTPSEIAALLGMRPAEVHFLLQVQAAVEGLDEVASDAQPAPAQSAPAAAGPAQLAVQQSF
jgi:hypothetical protein